MKYLTKNLYSVHVDITCQSQQSRSVNTLKKGNHRGHRVSTHTHRAHLSMRIIVLIVTPAAFRFIMSKPEVAQWLIPVTPVFTELSLSHKGF